MARGRVIALTSCSALCSYRGYGLSEGSPSERGLQQDSQAALDYLLRRPDVHPRRVGAKPRSSPSCFACGLQGVLSALRLHSSFQVICTAAASPGVQEGACSSADACEPALAVVLGRSQDGPESRQ